MPSCRQLHGLHGTAFSRAVQHLQLRHDDLFDKRVRLGGEHVTMRILFKDLDAGPVHQESVVEDEKVIIKNAKRVTLFANDKWLIYNYYKVCKIIEKKSFISICKMQLFYFEYITFIIY